MHPRVVIPIVALLVLLVLAVVGQFAIPPIVEDQTEDRIERFGGHVQVELSAFPALRLLFDDGERIDIQGGGQRIDLEDEPADAFGHLDGFDEVRMVLTDLEAGPLAIGSFDLRRGEDDEDYTLKLDGETSPREMATYLGGRTVGELGSTLGDVLGDLIPGGESSIPVQIEAEISSRDGRAEALEASGSVAGIPAGPLAEVVADAVVRRL
jgi:hypothetical protein